MFRVLVFRVSREKHIFFESIGNSWRRRRQNELERT